MNDDLVEAGAKGLYGLSCSRYPSIATCAWEEIADDANRDGWRERARAALEALVAEGWSIVQLDPWFVAADDGSLLPIGNGEVQSESGREILDDDVVLYQVTEGDVAP